ncbi:hypothetical protein GCM10009099_05680 [Caenispirillum bisanense]
MPNVWEWAGYGAIGVSTLLLAVLFFRPWWLGSHVWLPIVLVLIMAVSGIVLLTIGQF